MQSWKSFTAREIRKGFRENKELLLDGAERISALPARALPAKGLKILCEGEPFWQREYWDRFIRDEDHFRSAVRYILENPLKAGLVNSVEQWPWSFAAVERA